MDVRVTVRPKMPRWRRSIDGRYGWPGAVAYEVCEYRSLRTGEVVRRPLWGDLPEPCRVEPTGEETIVPPSDGRPYRRRVLDQAAYEALASSGRLSGAPHRQIGGAVDHRSAPGA